MALQDWAERTADRYAAQISRLLGVPVTDFNIRVVSPEDMPDGYEGNPGATVGTTIYLNRSQMDTGNEGLIIHEVTHAMAKASGFDDKAVELLPDWVRWKLGGLTETGGGEWTPSAEVRAFDRRHGDNIRRWVSRLTDGDEGGRVAEEPAAREGVFTAGITALARSMLDGARVHPRWRESELTARNVALTLQSIYNARIQAGLTPEQAMDYVEGAKLTNSLDGLRFSDGSRTRLLDSSSADADRDGEISEQELLDLAGIDLGGGGIGETAPSRADYVNTIMSAGVPMSPDLRSLVKEALRGEWSLARFENALMRSEDYFQDQSISYEALLAEWGIEMTGNLQNLLRDAVESGYSETEFTYFLRQTEEYRKRFRGIFKKNGDIRMSEAEYLNFEYNLETLGKQYGYKIETGDVGRALRKGITLEGYEDRLSALQRMREYEPSMKNFQAVLKARGLLPKGARDWTKQEQFDFITGQSNPQFYRVWEEASAATAAHLAGIDVLYGKEAKKEPGGVGYTDIRRGLLLQIIKSMPGYQTEAELAQGMEELGYNLLKVLPLSEARSFGLTKQDIVRATFGGKNAARAEQKLERVVRTHEAFQEDRASTALREDQEGRVTIQQGRGFGGGSEY